MMSSGTSCAASVADLPVSLISSGFDLVAMLAHPHGEAGQHLGASLGAAGLPLALRPTQARRDTRHVGGVGPAHLPGYGAGRGIADGAG